MKSTAEVLQNHLRCFEKRDLAGILADYAAHATLFTPDGPLRGTEAIRPLFEALFVEFDRPGAAFSVTRQDVEGDHAYILWDARTANGERAFGTDTFIVRDGTIAAQSVASTIWRRL